MRPYDLVKSIFLQALDVPAAERAAFVAAECAGDDGLRTEVESLLRFHDETLGGLEPMPDGPPPVEIAGWRIEAELGRGGMGIVYRARRDDGPAVALKVLRPGLLSPMLLARFRREAAALARLDHPGIARLVATGIDEGATGPRPWLAMELVEGEDLRHWAATGHAPAERLELLARVCDIVEHAHAQGVVHRDLKPENVLVRADGQPVVLDFGVARLADTDLRATSVMTSVGVLVGTIRYMSPEQAEARSEDIGPRSDVHALGVIAYELLTGRLPYDVPEQSIHRALVAVMTAPPRPMSELPQALRAPLERVLRAALAKLPADRTASAAALGEDLRRVAAGRPPLARPVRGRSPLAAMTPWLPLASGALMLGLVLSAWRTPPTPADFAQGLLRPAATFDRVVAMIDSAAVRLHYTTRTLGREREALAWAQRARLLARTVGWRPWGGPLERLATFRAGEAKYLIAERTNDVAAYVEAARLWRASCDPGFPRRPVPLPDTTGASAGELTSYPPAAPWLSASMALADAARLARPADLYAQALAMAREGEAAMAPLFADSLVAARRGENAPGWEGGAAHRSEVRAALEARLGVAMVGLGFASADTATLDSGLVHLRRAAGLMTAWNNPAAAASHLHELGAGEARLAAFTRSRGTLDSAFVHLRRAYAIRSALEGYTSRYLSRLELGQAERLAARLDPAPGAATRHLDAAAPLIALARPDLDQLGRIDRGLYVLAAVGLTIDRAVLSGDTTAVPSAEAALSVQLHDLDGKHGALLGAEVELEWARIEALRWSLAGDARARRRLEQMGDFVALWLRQSQASRPAGRQHLIKLAAAGTPRQGDLDWPLPEPY